jgi:histidine triad (HIT) family protein
MDDCVFCKIIKGDIPCVNIYEDKNFLAFLDIHLINKGHVLVVVKEHFDNIFEIDDEEIISNYFRVIKKISGALAKITNADGNSIHMDNGVEQKIIHAHVHIIPRFNNDGLRMMVGGSEAEWNEMEKIGERIRKELI